MFVFSIFALDSRIVLKTPNRPFNFYIIILAGMYTVPFVLLLHPKLHIANKLLLLFKGTIRTVKSLAIPAERYFAQLTWIVKVTSFSHKPNTMKIEFIICLHHGMEQQLKIIIIIYEKQLCINRKKKNLVHRTFPSG